MRIWKENTFLCDKKPCRINLDFRPIFDDEFKTLHYKCTIETPQKEYDTCNPPQISFDTDTKITITLEKKFDKHQISKDFFVKIEIPEIQPPKNDEGNQQEKSSNTQNSSKFFKYRGKYYPKESTPPEIIVASDGKWEKDYKWLNDENIECFPNSCAVNLNASKSYSYEKIPLKFSWTFGKNGKFGEKNQKNPGKVVFSAGEYEIFLLVKDRNNVASSRKIIVQVPEKYREKNKKTNKNNTKNAQKKKKSKNSIKNEEEEFVFKEPEIVVQNPKNIEKINETEYICHITTKKCSINFALSDVKKGGLSLYGNGTMKNLLKVQILVRNDLKLVNIF